MEKIRYVPRYISGQLKSDPNFYLKDSYWEGVTHSVLIATLKNNDLAKKIVIESLRRKIPVDAESPELLAELDQLITGAAYS